MKLGFTKVFNLHGGLNAWVKDNLPLAKTAPGGKAQLEMTQPRRDGVHVGLVSVLSAGQGSVDQEERGVQRNQRRG